MKNGTFRSLGVQIQQCVELFNFFGGGCCGQKNASGLEQREKAGEINIVEGDLMPQKNIDCLLVLRR